MSCAPRSPRHGRKASCRDPKGQSIEIVGEIRDEIRALVTELSQQRNLIYISRGMRRVKLAEYPFPINVHSAGNRRVGVTQESGIGERISLFLR